MANDEFFNLTNSIRGLSTALSVKVVDSKINLPKEAETGIIYCTKDTSNLYIYSNKQWEIISGGPESTTAHIYEENKKIVPFTNCYKCGAPMKSFKCDYCGADYSYLK